MWWFLNGYWFDNVVAYKLAKLAYNTGMPFVGYASVPGDFLPVYYA